MRVAQMVGRSFRCAIHARRELAASSWSYAWQEIANVAGADHADRLIVALGDFVESVDAVAARQIEVLPKACPGLCRDECLAVSAIAASQLGECPAMKACLFALVETAQLEETIRSAASLSCALRDAGQALPPDAVCNALALMPAVNRQNRCHG
jgi:hypothetical protein